MKIIAHRGNLNGPDPARENTIEQAEKAIEAGFDVEIDLWQDERRGIMSGHAQPINIFPWGIPKNTGNRMWVHWKQESAFLLAVNRSTDFMHYSYVRIKCFMHDKEPFARVSNGAYWLYPGTPITDDMLSAPAIVACLPELAPDWDTSKATHICTDYPIMYREKYM